MADTPPPAKAIEAQQAYDKADAEVQKLLNGDPVKLQKARDARMKALMALLPLKRWEGDGGPIAAETALRVAARPKPKPEETKGAGVETA